MLYLTCTTITSVDLAYYGVSRAKDWVSVIVVQANDNLSIPTYHGPQVQIQLLLLLLLLYCCFTSTVNI